MAERFRQDFRRFFLRGLAAVLPTLLTIVIIVYIFTFVQSHIGSPINDAVKWVVVQYRLVVRGLSMSWTVSDADKAIVDGYWRTYKLGWIGFALGIMAIYIFGRFVASFIGRGIWRLIERAILSLPVVKQIYPYVKQVTDFLFSERKFELSRVVAVEYPRKGCWSLGLVTSPGMREMQAKVDSDLLTVFIPSSPTPVTGYTVTVRRDEVIDLPLSIDEALRFTVSGGVIMPPGQRLSKAEIEQVRQGILPAPKPRKET